MNKTLKIILITAAVLITVGLALSAFSAIFFSGSIRYFVDSAAKGGESEQKTLQLPASDTDKVMLRIANANVVVTPSKDGNVSITYNKYSDENYRETADSGVLGVEQTDSMVFGIFNWFQNREHTVEISIPENCTADVTVNIVNGSIEGKNISLGSLTVSQTNGSISLSTVTSRGDVVVDTVNVGISADGIISGGEIRCKSVNGKIENGVLTGKSVNCETVNGKIGIKHAVSDAISCKTVNGEMNVGIEGSSSEYSIKYSSVNGSLTVDNHELGKSAEMNSDTGKTALFQSVNGSATVDFTK